MLDGVVAFNELALVMRTTLGVDASPGMHGLAAPFGAYATADGHVVIAVLGEPVWLRFARAMDRMDLGALPELGSGLLRHKNRELLDAAITGWIAKFTTDEVLAELQRHDVPSAPVLSMEEVLKLDNLRDRGMIVEIDDPVWGRLRMAGNPLHSSLMEGMPLAPAPELGADNAGVLADWLATAAVN
jgi:formyl-CoA transferase